MKHKAQVFKRKHSSELRLTWKVICSCDFSTVRKTWSGAFAIASVHVKNCHTK